MARDLAGRRFGQQPPHIRSDLGPLNKAYRAGLPIPAYCCWNGMAKLDAAPLRAGVRFRDRMPGECFASECSLLCDDFHRLGYRRVVVDPSIVTTYEHHVKVRRRHWATCVRARVRNKWMNVHVCTFNV